MKATTHGIHHVTAMAGDPQKNLNFYVGVLGLRMVKKTVNFDDPHTYHFYFGNEHGQPGTIMTFFPWGANGLRGRGGVGQLTTTSFAIPEEALPFWQERLAAQRVVAAGPYQRLGEAVLTFEDPDGLEIDLITTKEDARPGWDNGDIPPQHAIRGFHSVTLSLGNQQPTATLLTDTLGYRAVQTKERRYRYAAGEGGPGTYLDILELPEARNGSLGVGAVHHVAWRAADDASQTALRGELLGKGYQVSPVMDRQYFHSIYFREPGGVLFEIATDPPGFTLDETSETLGSGLKLPPWLEKNRSDIETHLPRVTRPIPPKQEERS